MSQSETWMQQQARATERRPRLDVIHAANLKPGDWYAGDVIPDAPTRPVQEFAAAHRLTEVGTFKTDERTWMRLTSGPFELDPIPASRQVLVIREA